jgi:hypothetical protein
MSGTFRPEESTRTSRLTCAARILDWIADLRYRQQACGGWLAGRVLLKIVYLLVRRVLGLAVLVFRGDLAKDAELLVLRHENAVLRRHVGRIRYEPADRAWFAALASLLPRRRWTEIFPVTPATLLAWHRKLAAKRYDTSRQRKPGRPTADSPEHRPPCRSAGKGESAVGIPPDPRRADEARRDGRAVHYLGDPARRRHRSGAAPLRPDLAAVPSSPGRRDPRGRLPARGHRAAQKSSTSWCSSSTAYAGCIWAASPPILSRSKIGSGS